MTWAGAAAFYDQLRGILVAGLPLRQALELAGNAASGRHRSLAPGWAAGCAAGATLAEQLERHGEPVLATALVRAGEASGRLPEMCGEIAGYYHHAVALRRLMISRLVYPVLLIHVALVAAAVPAVVVAGYSPLLLLVGPAVLWVLIATAVVIGSRLGPAATARLALLPGLRGLTLPLVAGNACLVLRAALAAGMLMPAALDLAAGACGNRVIATRLRAAAAILVASGQGNLTSALGQAGFPAVVVQLVANGEVAGRLEETLARCAELEREAFRLRSEWTARVVAGTIYGLAMLLAAATVLFLASGYVSLLDSAAAEAGSS
jgi:type II secretory pathway component PulF